MSKKTSQSDIERMIRLGHLVESKLKELRRAGAKRPRVEVYGDPHSPRVVAMRED